jgi:drug/metabolite transporter (DMT)-like permease
LLLALVVIWGGNYTWIKLGLRNSGPWTFNAFRYGSAVLMLAGALLVRGGPQALLPARGERLLMAVIGFLQVAVMTGGTTLAMTRIEASRTVLIAYSMPVWGLALSALLLRERVTWAALLGLALGIAGLCLLSAPWAMDWTSASSVIGSALALAGTLGWALGAVIYRSRAWRTALWTQVFWQIAIGAVPMVLGALLLERTPFRPTAAYAAIMAYNGLVPTILGYWCWTRAIDRISVPTASQVLMLSPVFGVLLSAIMLGERLSLTLLASGLLIVAGAVLSYMRARPAV